MEIYRKLPDDLKSVVLQYIPPSPSAQLIKDFREKTKTSFKTVNESINEKDFYVYIDTSLQGYIKTTKKDLEKIFGKPMCADDYGGISFLMDTNKSHFEWIKQFKDGTIATIYDYAKHANPSLAKETLENEPYE